MRVLPALGALLVSALPAQQSRCTIVSYGRTCGPVLYGSVTLDGANRDISLSLLGATPSAFGFHVFGVQRTDLALPGGCPLLATPAGIVPFLVDPQGRAQQRFLVPYASTLTVVTQDVVFYRTSQGDTFETTNGLQLGPWQPIEAVVEGFTTNTKRDPHGSGVVWQSGSMRPGQIGGSGVLGDFEASDGRKQSAKDAQGRDVYDWNTDSITIPGSRTLTGQPITVNNGVLEFMSFVVKPTERVRFHGSKVPVITATGLVSVQGAIELWVPEAPRTYTHVQRGIFGGLGGCGGASGGQGGDSPQWSGGQIHGRPGGDVVVPLGHPRAGAARGTGGGGATAHPANGLESSVVWIVDSGFTLYSAMIAAGGAGGSYFDNLAGALLGKRGQTEKTKAVRDFWNYLPGDVEFGPPSTPGVAFPNLPFDSTQRTLDHLVIGGSGGGGGGLHPFYSLSKVVRWSPGAGGAGGGGGLVLRSGGELRVELGASIEARGGNAPDINTSTSTPPIPAPGGGGSGGTVLAQCAGTPTIQGGIDVLGGRGGVMSDTTLLMVRSRGGAGGAGYVRIEANTLLDYRTLTGLQPAASADNVALLRNLDHDKMTAGLSKWYDAGRLPQAYHYYVIQAVVDSTPVVFSDNPKVSSRKAQAGEPVVFSLQSARLDRNGVPLDAPTPWAEGSIDAVNDSPNKGNGFRFFLRLDRSKTNQDFVAVTRVQVFLDC